MRLRTGPKASMAKLRIRKEYHMKQSSKNRLTPQQQVLFPGASLFDAIARAVCRAGVLPRKELHEAWETAKPPIDRFHSFSNFPKGGNQVFFIRQSPMTRSLNMVR